MGKVIFKNKEGEQFGNTTLSGEGHVQVPLNDYVRHQAEQTAAGGMQGADRAAAAGGSTSNVMTQQAKQTAQPSGIMAGAAQQAAPGVMYYPYGLRETAVERGVADNRIGWNEQTGMVTLDGRDVYKPKVNDNGTVYVGEKDMNGFTDTAYKMAGDELVGARQYADNNGIEANVLWDNGSQVVEIGGHRINPKYISSDGIAMVPRSELDRVMSQIKAGTGQSTPQEVVDSYNKRYDSKREHALDELLNRKQFDYNPESDPVYQAYRDMYIRNGELVFKQAQESANRSTAGNTGMSMSQAIAAREDYNRQLNDVVSILFNAAYSRYMGETERLRNNLSDTMAVGNDFYGKDYAAQNDAYEQSRNNKLDNYNELSRLFSEQETALNNEAIRRQMDTQTTGQGLSNEYQSIYNAYAPQVIHSHKIDFDFWDFPNPFCRNDTNNQCNILSYYKLIILKNYDIIYKIDV